MLELETNNRKQTDTYDVKSDIYNGFMLDIVTTYNDDDKTPEFFNAVLYHQSYGIRVSMFGVSATQNDYEGFLQLVIDDIEVYIFDFINDYCRN